MARPDFGVHEIEKNGVVLSCQRIAPGLTMHDLVMLFERARNEAEPGDRFAGDPSKWPDVRGVRAVADAILDAVYGK